MQYARRFLSVVGIFVMLAAASGCEDEGGSTSGSTSSSNNGDTEPAALQGITAAHNEARANVQPAAQTSLPPLEWSGEVAAVAQAYAEKCIFEHNPDSPYGENLYAATGGSTPQGVVKSWVDEVAAYDYASNSCSGVCGHYTQVVWANSLRLGCGMAVCDQNSPFGGGSWEIWVCNYDPPGNWVGEKPY